MRRPRWWIWPQASGNRFGVLSIAVAACVACCTGPLIALLGGLSLAGPASTMLVGGVGVVVAVLAGIAVRRLRTACDDEDGDSVPVAEPTRRAEIAANVSEQTR